MGLPWWSSGWDFAFQMQGVQVPSLVGKLGFHMPRGQRNQSRKQKQCCNKFSKDFEKFFFMGFPGGEVDETPLVNARDTGSHLGLGRSPLPQSS